MKLQELLRYGEEQLIDAEIADAKIDAWLLLEWITGISRMDYFMDPQKVISLEHEMSYKEAIAKRMTRIPLQHITGEQEFMGITFQVNEHVLIPRQDTECLVELAIGKWKPGMKVLDMCTGSGCIAISLEQFTRQKVNGEELYIGSDVSEDALAVARENGLRTQSKVQFVQSDLFEQIEGSFEMILSNPPYIRTKVIEELEEEVKLHDPMLALDGKEDGLYFYRRIIQEARAHLTDGGYLIFEIGHDQRKEVMALMEEAGYQEISSQKDLAGLDRVVFGRYYYN